MTISTTIIKNSYSGNGSNTSFTYGFKITDEDFIQVIVKTNATGAESVRAIGTGSTNYSVTGINDASGGSVVFVTAPTNLETVILRRSTTQTQALDLIENDNLPANSLENAFDKNLSIIQELQEQLDRSIKLSRANTMTSTEFTVTATDRANKVLAFDSSGEISVTQELGTFKGNSATTTNAAYVVRDIVKSTTSAQLNNIYICIQASPVGTALTNTSYWALIVDAVSAATSATASANSATASANSATASANSATASANSATASASSASTASTQASNASSSATAAAASLDSFDDRYLGAKSSAPSTDNDGNALLTGALYFNSSQNIIYNWTGSAWQSIRPTSSEQTAINTLAASAVVADMALLATTDVIADMALLATSDVISDMNALAVSDVISDINTLATSDIVSDLNTLATSDIVSDINTLATSDIVSDLNTLATSDIVSDINTLATSDIVSDLNLLATSDFVSDLNVLGTSTNVTNMSNLNASGVLTNIANLNASGVITNIANLNASGVITNMNNVGGSIGAVNSAAANLASINNFGLVYRVASSAPSSSLNSGDLYFNTSTNVLNVYGASGWQNAGSSVNGTTARFKFVASGTPTTFSGNDANGNSLSYDAGFIDVYLNGIKMVNGTDVTVTSGSAIVFASAVTSGDIIEAIAFGTFAVANLNASSLSSGTVPDARITGAYTGITNLTMTGNLTVDTNTLFVDSSNNRVGINTNTPGFDLVVKDASGAATIRAENGADNKIVDLIADSTGGLLRTIGSYPLVFNTNQTERARIDASGNLLLGMTSNGVHNSGIGLVPNGVSHFYTGGDRALELGRGTNDGEILRFNRSGTTIGSIGVVNSNNLFIQGDSTNSGLQCGTNAILPVKNSANSDNTIDLGQADIRWNDIYLGGGAYIGGTSTANKLDDYEEGTWTPAFNEGSGDSTASATNTYTKVGRVVVLNGYMYNSNGATSGNEVRITGLPFSAGSTRGEWKGSLTTHAVSFNTSAIITTTLNGGHTYVRFTESRSGTSQDRLTYGDAGTGHFQFSITYITDA